MTALSISPISTVLARSLQRTRVRVIPRPPGFALAIGVGAAISASPAANEVIHMSELTTIRALLASNRVALDRRAIRWACERNAPRNTLRAAITAYLSALDPMDPEWAEWIDTYGEAKLSSLFGVEL